MKKRLFLLFCGVMCLFFVLCSCGCDNKNTGVPSSSHNHDHDHSTDNNTISSNNTTNSNSTLPPTNNSGNSNGNNNGNGDISVPETKCELNDAGHYWSNVVVDKNTSSTGTVSVYGKCHLCKEDLHQVYTTIVTYEEWKNALSTEGLSSFTTVVGDKYTDYDKTGAVEWKEVDKTYTANYFINSPSKNSGEQAKNFYGFALQFNDFKYDNVSKTYVYWINENSYIELGFANGKLFYHATVSKNGDNQQKSATLYLNHNRISIDTPDFIRQKYGDSISVENLSLSTLGSSLIEKINNELKSFSFDWTYEASLLENDQLTIYFYLDTPRTNPFLSEEYRTASVIVKDGKLTSVTFGNTTYEIVYN